MTKRFNKLAGAAALSLAVAAPVFADIKLNDNFSVGGYAVGEANYRDFLIFARMVEGLEGGVVLCYGTAVMGPEVYLKALSMVRNVASAQGRSIRHFTSAVFDLGASDGSDIAANKDAMLAEAFASSRRPPRRRIA